MNLFQRLGARALVTVLGALVAGCGDDVVQTDPYPPVLSIPSSLTVTATSSAGAVVTWTGSATDVLDGTDPVTCAPASGSAFPVGETTVTCKATDSAHNTTTGTFIVTVEPAGTTVIALSVGEQSSVCALISDGTVQCWGLGNGTLGNGIELTAPMPTPVAVLSSAGGAPLSGVVAVSTGGSTPCVLINNGTAQCWGDNGQGQLGYGTAVYQASDNNMLTGYNPGSVLFPMVPVTASSGSPLSGVTAIAAGGGQTNCALLQDTTMSCWGDNNFGGLGNGSSVPSSAVPVTVIDPTTLGPLTGVVAVTAQPCALLSDGTVLCWGYNASGQVGNGTTTNATLPAVVMDPTSGAPLASVTAISGDFDHVCALINDSTVRCWGDNTYGELGNGTTVSSTTPVAVMDATTGAPLAGVTEVSAGVSSTCALINDSTLRCWGLNNWGQLGNGNGGKDSSTANSSYPVTVVDSTGTPLSGATSINVGNSVACGVFDNSSSVMCWGDGGNGALGSAYDAYTAGVTTDYSNVPVPIQGLP